MQRFWPLPKFEAKHLYRGLLILSAFMLAAEALADKETARDLIELSKDFATATLHCGGQGMKFWGVYDPFRSLGGDGIMPERICSATHNGTQTALSGGVVWTPLARP